MSDRPVYLAYLVHELGVTVWRKNNSDAWRFFYCGSMYRGINDATLEFTLSELLRLRANASGISGNN
jgi:hypothetical protein